MLEGKIRLVSIEGKYATFILPTFYNLHLHLGESLFSNLTNYSNLEDYLRRTDEWNSKLANKKDIAWKESAEYTIGETLKYGCTAVCSPRGWLLESKKHISSLSGYPFMNSDKLSSYLSNCELEFEKIQKEYSNSREKVGIFLHSLYMVNEEMLKKIQKIKKNNFLTVHVAETLSTEEKVRTIWSGMSSIEVLEKYSLLDDKTLLVHGCYLDNEELNIIAKRGCTIAICPISNMHIAKRILDPALLNYKKINWCICTDGLGTGLSLNLIEQCRVLKKVYPNLENYILLNAITNYPKKFFEKFLPNCERSLLCKVEGDGSIEKLYKALFEDLSEYQFLEIFDGINETVDLTQIKSKKINEAYICK